MLTSNAIKRAVRYALLSSAAATVTMPVYAAEESIQEVVVTGTRIVRPDYEGASPIVSVAAEEVRDTGATSVDQLLNTMPQFVPSFTNTSNNPGNGQANIDLRGLGTQRNLVLMNGRRLPPSGSDGTVDVNLVPTALLQRIEVLTGGGSSVYGSDAIAGVTNFVLNDKFTGVQVDGGFNETDRSDGIERTASIAAGTDFSEGRGHIIGSVGYTNRDGITQGEREFSMINYKVRKSGLTPNGSGTIPYGKYSSAASNPFSQAGLNAAFGSYGFAPGTVTLGQGIAFNTDGTLFSTGSGLPGSVTNYKGPRGADFSDQSFTYNFSPPNQLLLPAERVNALGMLSYDFDAATVYMQYLYAESDVDTQLAAVPAGGFTIPANHPNIPPALAALLASRPTPGAPFSFGQRFTQVGPRLDQFDNRITQGILGFKGNLTDTWTWDAYVGSGHVKIEETLGNDVDLDRVADLLTAPDGGVAICGGYNPFGDAGMSPGCASYVRVSSTNITTIDQHLAEAIVTGDVFQMPAGAAKASFGINWREEKFDFAPDELISSGASAGFPAQDPLSGFYTVREASAELYMPFLKDAAFAKRLDATVGVRLSDYSTIGSAVAYKAEGTWQMVDAVGFRGSYQRAVRAPNIDELFTPPGEDFPPLVENPCNAASDIRKGPDAARVRDLCVALGVPLSDIDGYNDPNSQVQTAGGGNPDLQEEKADTFTFGVVFTSPWDGVMSDLKASIDYYNISIDNAIETAPAGEIFLMCFNYQGANPGFSATNPLCGQVDFAASETSDTGGPVIQANDTANIAKLETAGIDVQVDWGFDLGGAGKLRVNFLANFLEKYDFTYPGVPTLEYKGTIGPEPGQAYPDWRGVINADWTLGPVAVGLRYRYLPSMDNRYQAYSPDIVGVPSVDYLDGTLAYTFRDMATLLVGVNNISDELPPIYTNAPQMNTDPSTYDVLGRSYFARVTVKF